MLSKSIPIYVQVLYRLVCALKKGDAQTVRDTAGRCAQELEQKYGCGAKVIRE